MSTPHHTRPTARGRKPVRKMKSPLSKMHLEALEERMAPAVFNVNTLADIAAPPPGVVTLRSAILAANATPGPNTINITVSGTYKLTLGELQITPNGNLSIVNTSGRAVTVTAQGKSRVIDINPTDATVPLVNGSNPLVTLQGFAITGGSATDANNPDGPNASGGGVRDQGNVNLTLTNMDLTGNKATADGGGVSMENVANTPWTLTINSSDVSNNSAGDAGGGVETDGQGKVFLNAGTVIENNTSVNQGAGVWLDAIASSSNPSILVSANLTVTSVKIEYNHALAANNAGGGIGNAGAGAVSIISSTILGNTVNGVGGGFGDQNGQGTLSISSSSITNNKATDGGGVMEGGPTTITGSTLAYNKSVGNGGGIDVAGKASIAGSTINDNTAGGDGGGVFANGATTITNSVIDGNTASGTGGGVKAVSTLNAVDDTIDGNTSFGDGGGVDVLGNFTLLGSVVDTNTSHGNGGGVVGAGAHTMITNSEIDGNSTQGNGGGVDVIGTTLTMQSSTVANNVASNGGGLELDTSGAGSLTGSTIVDSTFTGNRALNNGGSTGGGVNAGQGFTGALLLLSDTIDGNYSATVGGGVFWSGDVGSTFAIENTIIADNTALFAPDIGSMQTFTASLDTTQAGTAATETGSGTASLVFDPNDDTLFAQGTFTPLQHFIPNLLFQPDPATAAHLHVGALGQPAVGGLPLDGNGNPTTSVPDGIALDAFGNPIAFTTVPANGGALGPQTYTVNIGPGQFLSLLQQGNVYINVHSQGEPGGAIRGQFAQTGGAFTDLGGNLIGTADGTDLGPAFNGDPTTQAGTAAHPLTASLGPLQNNGGPTIGALGHTMTLQTMAPLAGSLAIGTGNPFASVAAPAVDERGFPSGVNNGVVNAGAVSQASKNNPYKAYLSSLLGG